MRSENPKGDGMFTTQQASELSGATLRQLQFWDERRYLVPSRQGHRRMYSAAQVRTAWVMREANGTGIHIPRLLKRSAGLLAQLQNPSNRWVVVDTSGKATAHERAGVAVVEILDRTKPVVMLLIPEDLGISLDATTHEAA